MINHNIIPFNCLTIEEISEQIHSGAYEADILLMHLCYQYDQLEKTFAAYKSALAEFVNRE